MADTPAPAPTPKAPRTYPVVVHVLSALVGLVGLLALALAYLVPDRAPAVHLTSCIALVLAAAAVLLATTRRRR